MANENEEVAETELPEEIQALRLLVENLEGEPDRLRKVKRDLVAAARDDKLRIPEVVAEVFDEIGNMATMLRDAAKTITIAVDGAYQYCDELSEGMEGEAEGEGEGEGDSEEATSVLTHRDASTIGTAITMALARLGSEATISATKPEEWVALRESLESALRLVAAVEEPRES